MFFFGSFLEEQNEIILFDCCTVYFVLKYQNVRDGVDWFNKQCLCLASRDHPSFRIQREANIMLLYIFKCSGHASYETVERV